MRISVHRNHKSISSLGQRFDKPWRFRIVPESFADSVDGFVNSPVEIDHDIARPQAFLQFFPRDDLTRTLNQRRQGLKGLLLQLYFDAALTQLAGSQIDLEIAEAEDIPACDVLIAQDSILSSQRFGSS
jgi:hypothetical protein